MANMINVEIKGLDEARKTLTDAAAKCKNLTPVLREISEIMLDSVQDNFEYQRDNEADKEWPDLSEITIKRREKKGHWPGPILRVKNLLYKSIQPRATATEAIVGTNMAYAAIHQFGGVINQKPRTGILTFKMFKSGKNQGKTLFEKRNTKRGYTYSKKANIGARKITIKARPYLTLSAEHKARIVEMLKTWLAGA